MVSFRLRKSIKLKKINKMKLDSVAASFTQKGNQVVLVMKPKRSVREKVFHTSLPHTSVHLLSMAFTKLHVKYDIRLNNHTLRCRAEKKGILNFLTNYQCQKRKPYKRHLLLFESRKNKKIVPC